jgi:hypothetical protein
MTQLLAQLRARNKTTIKVRERIICCDRVCRSQSAAEGVDILACKTNVRVDQQAQRLRVMNALAAARRWIRDVIKINACFSLH